MAGYLWLSDPSVTPSSLHLLYLQEVELWDKANKEQREHHKYSDYTAVSQTIPTHVTCMQPLTVKV